MLEFINDFTQFQLILFIILCVIAIMSVIYFVYKVHDYRSRDAKAIKERQTDSLKEGIDQAKVRSEELAERRLKALAFNATLKRAIEASESGDINTAKYLMHELDRKYHSLINELVYENDNMTANDIRKFTMMRKYGVPYAFRIKDIKDNESKD
jgi:hypothetical protein